MSSQNNNNKTKVTVQQTPSNFNNNDSKLTKNGILKLYINTQTKLSNIYDVMNSLHSYVIQNLLSLDDCIKTLKLKKIKKPTYPKFTNSLLKSTDGNNAILNQMTQLIAAIQANQSQLQNHIIGQANNDAYGDQYEQESTISSQHPFDIIPEEDIIPLPPTKSAKHKSKKTSNQLTISTRSSSKRLSPTQTTTTTTTTSSSTSTSPPTTSNAAGRTVSTTSQSQQNTNIIKDVRFQSESQDEDETGEYSDVPIELSSEDDSEDDSDYSDEDDGTIDDEDEEEDDDIDDHLKLENYKIKYQSYQDDVKRRLLDLKSLYGTLMELLNSESKNIIKGDKRYSTAKSNRNGLLLWIIIFESHRSKVNETNITFNQIDFLDRYASIHQKFNQSLSDYYEYFVFQTKNFKTYGLQKPDKQQLAIKFLKSLNREVYKDMHSLIEQQKILGAQPPKTLEEAYQFASRFTVNNQQRRNQEMRNVFNSSKKSMKGKHNNKVKDTKDKDSTNDSKKNASSVAATTTSTTPTSTQTTTPPTTTNSPTPSPDNLFCKYCKRNNHNIENCFRLKKKNNNNEVVNNGFIETSSQDYTTDYDPTVHVYSLGKKSYNNNLVLYDTGAQGSIFHNQKLLINIDNLEKPILIKGVGIGSNPITCTTYGILPGFSKIKIPISSEVKQNILSASDIIENYDVEFDSTLSSYLICGDDNITYRFDYSNKLFSRIFQLPTQPIIVNATSSHQLSQGEMQRVTLVKDISKKLGFESLPGLARAVRESSISNLPITLNDIRNAEKVLDPDIAMLKGKTTRETKSEYFLNNVNKSAEKIQTLTIDIMYVEGNPYLISVSKPLDLVIIDEIDSTSNQYTYSESIKLIITSMLALYRSEGFFVNTIFSDNESTLTHLKYAINNYGCKLITSGVKTNALATIDRKIRFVKERLRSILSNLPYQLPHYLLKYAIFYTVSRINLIRHSESNIKISPKELFTGIRSNYNVDLKASFGDYVQSFDNNSDNTMRERTKGCLVLCPSGNRSNSWKLFCLSTKRIILSTQWKQIHNIPDTVINYINDLSNNNKATKSTRDPVFSYRGKIIIQPPSYADYNDQLISPEEEYDLINHTPLPNQYTPVSRIVQRNDDFSDAIDPDEQIEEQNVDDSINIQNESTIPTQQLINNQIQDNSNEESNVPINTSFFPSSSTTTITNEDESTNIIDEEENIEELSSNHLNHNIIEVMNISLEAAIKEDPTLATTAAENEITQMIEKEVFIPINYQKLAKNVKPISSFIFMKKKLDQQGNLIKWKARLVAGGNHQIRLVEENYSSPTPNIQSIFLIALLAAKEKRHVSTFDIGGAYLHAEMNKDIFMRLDSKVSKIIIQKFPYYKNFLQPNGTIIVKLLRALYGCLESARLWYNHISTFLISIGFVKSNYDECVFTQFHEDDLVEIGMFVDDFIITSKNINHIKNFENILKERFKEITINHGKVHNYLGMQFDFTQPSTVKINMPNYVDNLLKEYKVIKFKKYPSQLNLFTINDQALLPKEKQDFLHSGVAKLLYLSTRTRPDISLAVNFLCTRVNKFTLDDESKFFNILEYLNYSKNIGLILKSNENDNIDIKVYADASFGICEATRCGQTGICVMVNNSLILWKSMKQKIVTKSSTESELVAAADSVSYSYQIKNLLSEFGYKDLKINIQQDNLSTIQMIINNKPTSQRTRHIDLKYFFLRNRENMKDIKVNYTPTNLMIADIMTKPLIGKQFYFLRNLLTNT